MCFDGGLFICFSRVLCRRKVEERETARWVEEEGKDAEMATGMNDMEGGRESGCWCLVLLGEGKGGSCLLFWLVCWWLLVVLLLIVAVVVVVVVVVIIFVKVLLYSGS